MGYYNFHAQNKNKIKQGHLVNWEVVKKWNAISPALILYFDDGQRVPIREERWGEYFELIDNF